MNVLFVIGNGFDKNLNIPTGYSDFYDYYLSKENDKNENAIALKHSAVMPNAFTGNGLYMLTTILK